MPLKSGSAASTGRSHLAPVAPVSPPFSAHAFLEWVGGQEAIVRYAQGDAIFTRGDACRHVLFIWSGGVKVSAHSRAGKEAVIAVLGAGDFLGEACLSGQPLRNRTAVAIKPSAVVPVEKRAMARLMRDQQGLSDRFIAHVLTRRICLEEDLADQLFGATEERVARALLRMAQSGEANAPSWTVPGTPAEQLAEMAGTTDVRAKACLENFSRQRFIEHRDDGRLTINRSLLTVVLRN